MFNVTRVSRSGSRIVGIRRWCAISVSAFVVVVSLAARCGSSTDAAAAAPDSSAQAPRTSGESSHAASDPKAFCAALLTAIQPLVKVPLTVQSAHDAHNDDMHTGEPGFAQCVFKHGQAGVTLTLSDEKSFDATPDKGFSALPGFGDKARAYDGSMEWVDVMKGKSFCEAIVVLPPEQITDGDWKQTGGKMCVAAYAGR